MLLLYSVLLALILGYITGGRVRGLMENPLRWSWMIPVFILIRLIVVFQYYFIAQFPDIVIISLQIIMYILILIFAAANIRILSIGTAGIGAFMKFVFYLLNKVLVALLPDNFSGIAGILSDWLGNIFYMPAWVPLINTFGIGDIFIAAGVFIYIVRRMKMVRKTMTISSLKRW